MIAAIPWKVVVNALPAIVDTARKLFEAWLSRPKVPPVDPNADVRTQLASMMEKFAALELAELDQAKLVSQMAEQLQGIAHRASAAYWLGVGGLLLALAALLLAVLR